MKTFALAAAISLLAVSGVAAQSASDALVDRSVRAVAADGTVSVVHFMAGGVAHLMAGENHLEGSWTLQDNQLCLTWPGQDTECWPWSGDLQPGVTVTATSDHGDTVQVTLED